MPIRGRPHRRSQTNEDALEVQGTTGLHETGFSVGAGFSHAPYTVFGVIAEFGDRKETGFSLVARVVDRKLSSFAARCVLVDIDGDTKTAPGFSVKAGFGGGTGYRRPPRIMTSRSLPVAPLLSPHREVLPSDD